MKIVTKKSLDQANIDVTKELDFHGFYDDKLQQVDVFLVPLGMAFGWQHYGTTGEIDIPRVSISRLSEMLRGTYTSLRDILRHEYAHAVADTHRGLMRSRRFREAFGYPHNWNNQFEFDEDLHVTPYAATAPAEDFAEVFMLYLKHKSVLPKCYDRSEIQKKWGFIKDLADAISLGKRSW